MHPTPVDIEGEHVSEKKTLSMRAKVSLGGIIFLVFVGSTIYWNLPQTTEAIRILGQGKVGEESLDIVTLFFGDFFQCRQHHNFPPTECYSRELVLLEKENVTNIDPYESEAEGHFPFKVRGGRDYNTTISLLEGILSISSNVSDQNIDLRSEEWLNPPICVEIRAQMSDIGLFSLGFINHPFLINNSEISLGYPSSWPPQYYPARNEHAQTFSNLDDIDVTQWHNYTILLGEEDVTFLVDGKRVYQNSEESYSSTLCVRFHQTEMGENEWIKVDFIHIFKIKDESSVSEEPSSEPLSHDLKVEWTFDTSAQFPGNKIWDGHMSGFTVWDIDNDGENEVLFSTTSGGSARLWCLTNGGDFEWIYPPINMDGIDAWSLSKVSLVDVTNDGRYELAFLSGGLIVLNSNGSLLWKYDENNQWNGQISVGTPQAFDVDRDGFVEFFISTSYEVILCIDHQGNLVWEYHDHTANARWTPPTIADIDQDDRYEILFLSYNHNLYCLDAITGQEKWKYDTRGTQRNTRDCFENVGYMDGNNVIIADINRDGIYEAITWSLYCSPSAVVVVNSQGNEITRWTHPAEEGHHIRHCQPMGDLDEDGNMDLAIMSSDAVYMVNLGFDPPSIIWEANFSLWSEEGRIPEDATQKSDGWSSSFPYQLIADIDGDNEVEILWLVPFPVVTDAATGKLEGYYANPNLSLHGWSNSAWWGDVDDDGFSEWICELRGSPSKVYCLTMGGRFPAKAYWPEYYNSAYPSEYQAEQDWMLLKSAYSNSLWFPIHMIEN